MDIINSSHEILLNTLIGIACFCFAIVLFLRKERYPNQKLFIYFLVAIGFGSFFRGLFWSYHIDVFLRFSILGFMFCPLIMTVFIEYFYKKHFPLIFKLFILIGLVFLFTTNWSSMGMETWWLASLTGYILLTVTFLLFYTLYKAIRVENKLLRRSSLLMFYGFGVCFATLFIDFYAVYSNDGTPRIGIAAALIPIYMASLIYGKKNVLNIKLSLFSPFVVLVASTGIILLLGFIHPSIETPVWVSAFILLFFAGFSSLILYTLIGGLGGNKKDVLIKEFGVINTDSMENYLVALANWQQFEEVTLFNAADLNTDELNVKHFFERNNKSIHRSSVYHLMRRKKGFSRRQQGLEHVVHFLEKTDFDFIYPLDEAGSFLIFRLYPNANANVYAPLVDLIGKQGQLIYKLDELTAHV